MIRIHDYEERTGEIEGAVNCVEQKLGWTVKKHQIQNNLLKYTIYEETKMEPAEQVFEELLPYLETLDSQIGGLIQLLKDKRITTTEELAQYARQADQASNVKERGLRVRMEYLFSNAAKRGA